MGKRAEHRKNAGQRPVPRVPEEHRVALAAELQRRQAERERLRFTLGLHRQALEQVRGQLNRERTLHRRAYEQNRWWVELALRWWQARRAA